MTELLNPTKLSALFWCLAALGSVGFGLSKTGIPGVGILGVALFQIVFDRSPGIALPLLIAADFVAGAAYFKHAIWSKMLRMFPSAGLGLVLGYFAMRGILSLEKKADAQQLLNRLIGWILIVLVALSIWWRYRRKRPPELEEVEFSHAPLFEFITGVTAGFTTMIANAAGPIMILYLLRMKLPKLQFIGTCSCFFLVLNCVKVPFMIGNGMITYETLRIDLQFIPFSLLGAFVGWAILLRINQALFESLCLVFTLIAAIWLVK